MSVRELEGIGPFRAVIFDFDGTIADSYDAITASINHVRAGRGLPPLEVKNVRPHVGGGAHLLLARTIPNCDPQTDVALYRAHHRSVMLAGTRLLPGVEETLTVL